MSERRVRRTFSKQFKQQMVDLYRSEKAEVRLFVNTI